MVFQRPNGIETYINHVEAEHTNKIRGNSKVAEKFLRNSESSYPRFNTKHLTLHPWERTITG